MQKMTDEVFKHAPDGDKELNFQVRHVLRFSYVPRVLRRWAQSLGCRRG